MHILLIHQFFLKDNEGGGSRWNEMTRIWLEEGHQVTVLTGNAHYMGKISTSIKGKWFSRNINKDGVKVISCYTASSEKKSFAGRLCGFLSFTISSVFRGMIYANEDYDLILVTSPPLFVGISGIVLSWWKSIRMVFEVRDLWPESAIETGVLKNKLLIRWSFWLEKVIYKNADQIAVLTPAFRDILIIKKGVPAEKIFYIPNAADFTISGKVAADFDQSDFRKEHDLENQFVLAYVGAHGIANHLTQILHAAEFLRDANVCFLLIGDGPEKNKLITEASERDLVNVRFINSVSKTEVFKYILLADMGVSVLKKAEIFKTIYSNKTFDYFSCKKPVLMIIDGISRRLVEDASAGIFAEPENPGDIAAKVRFCMANPDLLKQQGENGYRFAKKTL